MTSILKYSALGEIIRTNRLLQNLSLSSLSEMANVSISYLSEIETGKKIADISITKRIFGALGKNYDDSPELILLVNNYFNKIYASIFFYQYDLVMPLLAELKENEELILSSSCITTYNLINYIIYVVITKDKVKSDNFENIIKGYIEHATDNYKQTFYLFYGMRLKNSLQLKEANTVLRSALNFGIAPELTSMIYYQLGIINQILNNHSDALEYTKEAKRKFDEKCNFVRSLFTYVHLGISYLDMSLMDKAEEVFLHCLDVAKYIKNEDVPMIVSVNLSWLYLLTQNYEKVNEYVQNAIDLGSKNPSIYVHNAIALLKLGKIEKCKEYVNLARLHCTEILDLVILNYVEFSIANDITKIKESLHDIQEYFSTAPLTDIQVKKFHMKELISVLESNGEFEEACHYYKELLALKN